MIQAIAMVIIFGITAALFVSFFYSVFLGYAVYFSTSKRIVERIIREIQPEAGATIFELGSGRAIFLRQAEKNFPQIKKLIGVEYFLYPYLVARIHLWLTGSRVRIIKGDMLKADINDADHIYCFLNRQSMVDLKGKFLRECKKGAQIISYQFSIPEMQPEKVIDVDNNKRNQIYFYRM